MFEVLIHRSTFSGFAPTSSPRVAALPAHQADEFALVMARNHAGRLGFDAHPSSEAVLNTLLNECYCLGSDNRLHPPGAFMGSCTPHFFFKDRHGAFDALVAAHERYVLERKRHAIVSRHRDVEPPVPSTLAAFLSGTDNRVDDTVYGHFISACQYFATGCIAGEYGWGAFTVVSSDMDGFLNRLEGLVGQVGRLVFKGQARDMPCW